MLPTENPLQLDCMRLQCELPLTLKPSQLSCLAFALISTFAQVVKGLSGTHTVKFKAEKERRLSQTSGDLGSAFRDQDSSFCLCLPQTSECYCLPTLSCDSFEQESSVPGAR